MYEKLARGHATGFINDLQDYGALMDWLDGPRMMKATTAFERSSFSKKPGRVLKRLRPLLHPRFQPPRLCHWTRRFKAVSAKGLAGTVENRVFHLPGDTLPLYSERAVFMAELLFTQDCDKIMTGVVTCASISHHAIARLVEREAVRPADLPVDIFFVLDYCAAFAEKTLQTVIDHTAMVSFLLPFQGGALVAVFMAMDPAQAHRNRQRRRILSVRTWLDADKLSGHDMERLGGLHHLTEAMMLDYADASAGFLRWIEGNARPWSFADSTMGDKAGDDVGQ